MILFLAYLTEASPNKQRRLWTCRLPWTPVSSKQTGTLPGSSCISYSSELPSHTVHEHPLSQTGMQRLLLTTGTKQVCLPCPGLCVHSTFSVRARKCTCEYVYLKFQRHRNNGVCALNLCLFAVVVEAHGNRACSTCLSHVCRLCTVPMPMVLEPVPNPEKQLFSFS
jgi:hypothetical protein